MWSLLPLPPLHGNDRAPLGIGAKAVGRRSLYAESQIDMGAHLAKERQVTVGNKRRQSRHTPAQGTEESKLKHHR